MPKKKNSSSKHTRQPIADIFRRSPFKAIAHHAKLVHQCIKALDLAVKDYTEERYEDSKKHIRMVLDLERDADLIKGNIRSHLPRFIFMPIDKADFLMFLREEDAVLDFAEDVAVLLDMRKTLIPQNCRKDFIAHTDKVVETALVLEKAVHMFVSMMESSMSAQDREKLKKVIHEIHKKEWEADQIEFRVSKKLFNSDSDDVLGLVHLLKVVDRTAQIANHAENAADRLRAMIAK